MTAVYGLAFVFLSICCLIALRVLWRLADHGVSLLGTFREWLPQWFSAQLESHSAVVKAADTLTETMGGMRDKLDKTHTGLAKTVSAVEHHARSRGNEFDSHVLLELGEARRILHE